ncbi:4Fe-4S binding protein, partial [Thermodesulfobacteriota bacterium]
DTVMVFDELCHGCGGCMIACPENAIHEELREIGIVERGKSGSIDFIHGILKIGQPMSPPLIKEVRREIPSGLVIIDAPPGTSCPVIASVQGSDFCLLVTEPTPFGLNDLKLAVEMVRALGVPFGVAINRAGSGDDETQQYCEDEGIPILAEIPDDRRVAELYSRGKVVSRELPGIVEIFKQLLERIEHP